MATYLVTGGAGFIGSHIVHALVERGETVRVLDNLSEGKLESLAAVADRIEFMKEDLRDAAAVARAVQGVDYVLHQAALRSVPRSVEEPVPNNDVNITGTLYLFLAAHQAGVKRVVYASSSSVYGGSLEEVQSELQLPLPLSPYAVSKMADEYYGLVFTRTYGLETVGLRYFNVFGPRQDPASEYAAVIPRFILAALKDEPLEVHGDGLQSRDFTYVDNVVQFNLLAATAPDIAGDVFNVGCGDSYQVLQIKSYLERILERALNLYHTPPRKGDARHTRADMSKARRMLGYEPTVHFEEGLRRTIEFFRKTLTA
ncbi:MAG: SDR family oxidoreductase [Acidobacteria bacterium]|nr:SDR family oxidoreductase [Acidobacteriota bacterium]